MTSRIIDKPRVGRSCPSIITLDAILNGDTSDVPVLEHIELCSSCAQRLEEMRMTNLFLTRAARDLKVAPRNSVPVSMPESTDEILFTRTIGYGSQGEVYEAVQVGTQRNVAVKVLKQGVMNSENSLARFQREIKLAASLDHPNIVTLHTAVDLPPDRHAYVMQFVEGETMDKWQARILEGDGASDGYVDIALCVFEKILRAAAYAHTKGIIHRDLKPKNVLVDANHEPHILDFGIACITNDVTLAHRFPADPADGLETQTNEFVGSPHYAAPEQLVPGLCVDERTDVFALGVMLRDAMQKSTARLALESRRVTQEDLRWVLSRALAIDPAERYSTATAFADDLVRLRQHRPVKAHPKSTRYVLHRLIQRRPAAVLSGAGIVLLIVLSMVVVFNQSNLISARNNELYRAGYLSSIDHAGALLESGSYLEAEQFFWDAFLTGLSESDIDAVDGRGPSLTSPALWGLRSLYARQPCLSTFQTTMQNLNTLNVLTFDGSGSLLFLLKTQGVLETWDWQAGTRLSSKQLTPGPILEMAHATNSSYAAVVTQGNPLQLILFDLNQGEPVEEFDFSGLYDSSRTDERATIAISADAKLLGVAMGREAILFDRVENHTISIPADPSRAPIASLDFDSGGTRLLVMRTNGSYEIRDTTTGQLRASGAASESTTPTYITPQGAFLPNDIEIIIFDYSQFILNLATGKTRPFKWHNQMYSLLEADHTSGLVATAFGAEIKVGRTLESDKAQFTIRGHRGLIRALALHGEDQMLASLDSTGVFRVWDLRTTRPVRIIQTSSSTIFSVDTVSDGDRIFSGDSNGALRTWSWQEGASAEGPVAQLDGMVSRVVVSPDEKFLAIGGDNTDPRLLLFGLPAGERLLDLREFTSRITGLVFSPDARMLAAAAGNDIIIVDLSPDAESNIRRVRMDQRIKGLDFSADGKSLVCTNTTSAFSLDARTLTSVGTPINMASVPRHIVASPTSDIIVVDGDDSMLRVFDRSTGDPLGNLIGHSQSDHWMDFHSSGELLLSAGEDSVLKIWDMRTLRCLATFEGRGGEVFSARFIPGTLRAVTGDTRGQIGLWDLESLDRYVAGNLKAAISRTGEGKLPPARTEQLRRWAQKVLAAQ